MPPTRASTFSNGPAYRAGHTSLLSLQFENWRSFALLSLFVICLGCVRNKSNEPAGGEESSAESKTSQVQAANSEDATALGATELLTGGDDPNDPKAVDALPREGSSSMSPDSALGQERSVAPGGSPPNLWQQNGAWSTRRLVALSSTGPTILDFSISVGQQSLEQASRQLAAEVAREVFQDLESPPTWDKVVEHPLVQSGWLGNLVPEEEQVEQLISMYDDQRDNIVTEEEFLPFLSRGLSRSSPMQVSDAGSAPELDTSKSPWGPLDQDQDFALSQAEAVAAGMTIRRYDYNGDSIVSMVEVNRVREMQNTDSTMGAMGGSMLDTNSLLSLDLGTRDNNEQWASSKRKFAKALLDRYTFAIGVPRDQWSSWAADRWAQVDSDRDEALSRSELEQVAEIPPDLHLFLRLPGWGETDAATEREGAAGMQEAETSQPRERPYRLGTGEGPRSDAKFVLAGTGGRVVAQGFLANLEVEDAFGGFGPKMLRDRLSSALSNPQLKAFAENQLQLQDGAFDLLDENEDGELDDAEFSRVWRWLRARQGARVFVRWMITDLAWFHLLDENADGRVSEVELARSNDLAQLDRSQDGMVTPDEMPLFVKVEIERTDSRLQLFPVPGSGESESADAADADWFAAMDTNQDGYIGGDEFLGETGDFISFDLDRDGFLSRSEVYEE